jgi:hypothetical protein
MENKFTGLSNFDLIDCYYCLRSALGEQHSLVIEVQEEIYIRMEDSE